MPGTNILFSLAALEDKAVQEYQGSKTQVIDLGKRNVIPGLNHPHIQVIPGGMNITWRSVGMGSHLFAVPYQTHRHWVGPNAVNLTEPWSRRNL